MKVITNNYENILLSINFENDDVLQMVSRLRETAESYKSKSFLTFNKFRTTADNLEKKYLEKLEKNYNH